MAELEEIKNVVGGMSLLLVDDDMETTGVLEKILGRLFNEVVVANDGNEAINRYQQNGGYDIVMTDAKMPVVDGFELAKVIKTGNPDQKIIMISGSREWLDMKKAFESEIDDFLYKPVEREQIFQSVYKMGIRVQDKLLDEEVKERLIQNEMSYRKRIHFLSTHDSETEYLNKNVLKTTLEEDQRYTLMLVNIDSFNSIKINYGYEFSDKLVKQFSEYLMSLQNGSATLFRISPDEFVFLFREKHIALAKKLAKRLQNKLNASPLAVEGMPIHFSATCGIAYGDGVDLIKRASLAVLEARKTRTKRVNLYSPSSKIEENQREVIQATVLIKNAINEDRLIPYFQPIVDLHSEKVIKYEALARIKEGGRVVRPSVFIEAAKVSGFTPEITRSIINSSFQVIKEREEGLSINITVEDLGKGYLPKYLESRSRVYGIDPRRISLEIIESEDSTELYKYLDQIKSLREAGYGISIDDFGTEHSNFHRLASLEVDEIKIDGMFIKDIDTNVKSQNIVQTISEFARRVGVKVVAEHIHTPEVLEQVRAFDIDMVQGYLFGKPKVRI